MLFQTIRKSCVIAVLAVGTLILPTFANAELATNAAIVNQTNRQIPSDESLEKLMTLQQLDKSIEVQNQQVIANLQKSTANILKGNTSSPEKTAKAQKILNDFVAESMKELNSPTAKAQYRANYISATKAIYNQQEVNAMIDFYSSPLGQQIIKKQDDFNADLMGRNLIIMQHWQEDLLKNKMPKLFNDLYNLKNAPNTK